MFSHVSPCFVCVDRFACGAVLWLPQPRTNATAVYECRGFTRVPRSCSHVTAPYERRRLTLALAQVGRSCASAAATHKRRSQVCGALVSDCAQRISTACAEIISLARMVAAPRVRWALRPSQPCRQSGLVVATACAHYCLVAGAACARYGLCTSRPCRQSDPDAARFFACFKLQAMTLRHLRSFGHQFLWHSDNQRPHARGLRCLHYLNTSIVG